VCHATLSILPDAVDVDAWQPNEQRRAQLRREFGMREDEFLWLAVGRLERGKDYPTLLRALAAIPPSARLVVAGGGPLLKALAHLATFLGLRERVTFLGFEPDLLRWFQAADGLVHTLRCDGMPATLLRAAACALPVVATDLPGAREIVLDEKTGMPVPAADAAALASAMTSIVRMPAAERLRMGASARRRAIEHFSLTACVSRWEELYGTLLRRKERNVAVQRVATPGFPARIR
jgi:glycosyltransferase involved in cell wall biosynthesis